LEECKAKDEINQILITPEEIAADIGKNIPYLDVNLQQELANKLQGFIHNQSEVYQNGTDFVGTYIEGVLLKIFIGVAKNNPKQPGKDTLIILTEKLLDIVTTKYQEIKSGKKVEDVIKDL